jgi:hypothetical protein
VNESTGIMIPKECIIDRCDEGVRDLLNSNNEYHIPYLDTYTGPWGDSSKRRTAPTPADALGAVVR